MLLYQGESPRCGLVAFHSGLKRPEWKAAEEWIKDCSGGIMVSYIIRRILAIIPLLLGVITISFFLMHLIPGDPAEAMVPPEAPYSAILKLRHELGLDKPLHIQYLSYLSRVIRGDLGKSIRKRTPVLKEIATRFPATAELALAAMLIALVFGIPAGTIAAIKRNSIYDHISMLFAWTGTAMPAFLLGLLLLLGFSVTLKWFPPFGRGGIRNLILPAITLGTYSTAVIARITRSSVLEVITQDYIKTAQAKGLSTSVVICKHILKNALIPTVTVAGLQVGYMLGGAVVTETIFAWPGIGRYAIQALFARDFPVIQGTVILTAIIFTLTNLLVDIVYVFLDPRIAYD